MPALAESCSSKGKPELAELLSDGGIISVRRATCARPLDAADADVLAAGLIEAGVAVSTLALPHHGLGDAGCAALAALLQQPSLETFDLTGNGIGAAGAEALKIALEKSSLKRLDLSWNPLGKRGGFAIADALAAPGCPLREVVLARADLDAAAIVALCAALRGAGAPPVEVLDISGSKLDAEQHEDVAKHVAARARIAATPRRRRGVRGERAAGGASRRRRGGCHVDIPRGARARRIRHGLRPFESRRRG